MSTVWVHHDNEAYVHDQTGLYRIKAKRIAGIRVEVMRQVRHLRGGVVASHLDGTLTIGATRVRVTVTRGLLRSPVLKVEQTREPGPVEAP